MAAKLEIICLFMIAALTSGGAAQPRSTATAPATRPTDAASARPARELSFEQTPLADAVQYFRDVYRLNIFVNWKMLESAGVNRETPVTVRARDITLRKALELVLASAGGERPLGFSVHDGVVTISTKVDLESRPETRVYDLTDLLLPEFRIDRHDSPQRR